MPNYDTEIGRAKAIRLSDWPEEAWVIFSGGDTPDAADLEEFWQAVAWLWRCVDLRAGKVAACKYTITRGSTVVYESDQEDPPKPADAWLARLPLLLAKVEAAACMVGRAYWTKLDGFRGTQGVAWLIPKTMTPVWSDDGELAHFERQIPTEGEPRILKPEEVVAFWPPDWTVEVGPAQHTPGMAALAAAGVLANMDEFLAQYFDRGAVKVTLLTYEGALKRGDAEELRTWWKKVASGVKNAFATHVVNAQKVSPVVIGEGVADLENSTLTAEKREDICTAMGVPQSKVTANAANYATKQGDDQTFVTDTIVPELRWIADTLNAQLFDPLGLRITFVPEEFSEMQTDENQRAAAFAAYVQAGLPLLLTAEMLGIYIPSEYEAQLKEAEELAMEQRRKLAEVSPTGQPGDAPGRGPDGSFDDDEKSLAPAARAWALAKILDEAGRFERWLANDPDRDPADFETDLLSDADKAVIVAQVRPGYSGYSGNGRDISGKQLPDDPNWQPRPGADPLPPMEKIDPEELADSADLARLIRRVERWARDAGVDLEELIEARPIEEAMAEE